MHSASARPPRRRLRGISSGPRAIPQLVDRLSELTERDETITVQDIVRAFGTQGHAPLLMVIALLMVLPVGMIPGVGGGLGVLAAAIGFQMLRGSRGVWLPRFIRRRPIPADRVHRLAEWLRPGARRLRRHLHIRLEILARGTVSVTIMALVLIVSGSSLLVVGAIPVATPLIGLPIAVFALGVLARDGAVVALGYAMLAVAPLVIWLAHRWFMA